MQLPKATEEAIHATIGRQGLQMYEREGTPAPGARA